MPERESYDDHRYQKAVTERQLDIAERDVVTREWAYIEKQPPELQERTWRHLGIRYAVQSEVAKDCADLFGLADEIVHYIRDGNPW